MEQKRNSLYQSNRIHQVPIERIIPNPRQPRRRFEEEPLRELAESIRQHGVLQPLSVQKTPSGYVLVAGERRLRAAGLAGLKTVPCILVQATGQESALLALVENLHRCDLHYLDEAAAIARLISTYAMSQEEAARRLGRSQSAVANKLRLLRLGPECTERWERRPSGCGGSPRSRCQSLPARRRPPPAPGGTRRCPGSSWRSGPPGRSAPARRRPQAVPG